MSMFDWAEQECRLACKKENPNYNFDSDDFDYGCSCYKSALKAFKSLCEDGHSGMSYNFTKSILIKLMENIPLSPIEDKDFVISKNYNLCSNEKLKELGLKSYFQCSRLSSLFRKETLDGKIIYHDVNRSYFIDIENPSNTYTSNDDFLDEMFPITMPYLPKSEKYKIYVQTFLTDKKNGDFDTRGIFYVITPEGEKIDINLYYAEGENHKWKQISKEEYNERLSRRIDKLNNKIAEHIIWTLISNSSTDKEIKRREKAFKQLDEKVRDKFIFDLNNLCVFFNNPDNYKYNTFNMIQAICKGKEEHYKHIKELCDIADYVKSILEQLKITYNEYLYILDFGNCTINCLCLNNAEKSPDDFETTDELLRYWGFNPDNCQYMFSSVELDLNYIFEPIKN